MSNSNRYLIKAVLATLAFPLTFMSMFALRWDLGVFTWPVAMIPGGAIFYGLWPSVINPSREHSPKSLFWHRIAAVIMFIVIAISFWLVSIVAPSVRTEVDLTTADLPRSLQLERPFSASNGRPLFAHSR